MQTANDLKKELDIFTNFEKAKVLQRFFKTGKGQYGEGDIFLGVIVPDTRKVAKKFIDLSLNEVKKILYSKIHEERLCALLILVEKYSKAEEKNKKIIFDFYIKNAKQANNWDLVDLSAPKIVGDYLLNKPRKILYKFAKSKNLWEKRISILSTYTFIKNKQFKDTFEIAKILLHDEHDLIQKAVGWMLREVGKIDQKAEESFLNKHRKHLSRITLRYAIERFPEKKRGRYLAFT